MLVVCNLDDYVVFEDKAVQIKLLLQNSAHATRMLSSTIALPMGLGRWLY